MCFEFGLWLDAATGNVLAEYIWLDGTPIAFVQSGQTYHIHVDHLGTPKVLTDASGQVVWGADYSPFGKASITSQGPTFNLRFPGQYFDAETRLHYNWRRYYDPNTGRYISSDPIGLAGGINTCLRGIDSTRPVILVLNVFLSLPLQGQWVALVVRLFRVRKHTAWHRFSAAVDLVPQRLARLTIAVRAT